MSYGKDQRWTTWNQPHDRCVSLPTSHTMNLTQLHCYQSAITPSALCSGLSSPRWINSKDPPLLYSCVSSSTSSLCIMNLTILAFRSIQILVESSSSLRPPLFLLGFLSLLPVPSFHRYASVMSRQRGNSKRDSSWKPNRLLLAIRPRLPLHPLTFHHHHHQPPQSSMPIASVVVCPSPLPMHAGSNGSISWETLWASTQGQFHTWPPLRNQLQSFLPIILRIRHLSLRQSICL
jgi:hypothetical protein